MVAVNLGATLLAGLLGSVAMTVLMHISGAVGMTRMPAEANTCAYSNRACSPRTPAR
jgi:hypothetical protein